VGLSVAKNALLRRMLVFASGNLLYSLGHFILIVMLARLGTPLLVGAYSLATALQNPIFTFSKMGMRQAQATEAQEVPFNVYMRLRSLFLVAAVCFGLALLPFAAASPLIFYVFIVVLAANIVESLSDIYYGLLLQNERQHVIGTSLWLRSLSSILSFALLYLVTGDAATSLLGLPIGWALIYLFHDRLRSRDVAGGRGGPSPSPRDLRRLLALLWPLSFASFLGQAGQGLPRYLIAWDAGTEVLGQISPALQLHVAVGMLAQSVSQSLLPGVARDLRSGETRRAWRRLLRVSATLLPVMLLGSLLCFALGPWIVRLVFGPGYELAGSLLGITSISWSFRALAALFQNIVVGKRDFHRILRLQTAIFVLCAAVLVPLSIVFGAPGAIWGMACGSAIQFVIFFLQARGQLMRDID
jgi:O-antigen/teichoic acid export membrane protein